MGSSPPDCSCRGETQDKRPKTARRSPPCPPELLFLTSARPTLRTSRRQRSTDTSCSTSRRRREEKRREEQSRAEQSRAEQSRAEQSRAEQSKAKQSKAKQHKTKQNKTKQNKTKQK